MIFKSNGSLNVKLKSEFGCIYKRTRLISLIFCLREASYAVRLLLRNKKHQMFIILSKCHWFVFRDKREFVIIKLHKGTCITLLARTFHWYPKCYHLNIWVNLIKEKNTHWKATIQPHYNLHIKYKLNVFLLLAKQLFTWNDHLCFNHREQGNNGWLKHTLYVMQHQQLHCAIVLRFSKVFWALKPQSHHLSLFKPVHSSKFDWETLLNSRAHLQSVSLFFSPWFCGSFRLILSFPIIFSPAHLCITRKSKNSPRMFFSAKFNVAVISIATDQPEKCGSVGECTCTCTSLPTSWKWIQNRLPGVPKLPWLCGFSSAYVVFSGTSTVENPADAVCGVITSVNCPTPPLFASVCLKQTAVAGDNRQGQQTELRRAVSHVVGSL